MKWSLFPSHIDAVRVYVRMCLCVVILTCTLKPLYINRPEIALQSPSFEVTTPPCVIILLAVLVYMVTLIRNTDNVKGVRNNRARRAQAVATGAYVSPKRNKKAQQIFRYKLNTTRIAGLLNLKAAACS